MIYVGTVFGGPEAPATQAYRVVNKVMCMIADERDALISPSDGGLNVVFHVSGSLSKVTFEGVRTGRFVRKEKMLMVQVAVPEELLDSDKLAPFLFQSIREAIDITKLVFKKAKILFSAEDHLALVDQVERNFMQQV